MNAHSISIKDLGLITGLLFAVTIAGFFAGRDSRQNEIDRLAAHQVTCSTDADCEAKNGRGPFLGQEPGTMFEGRELGERETLNGVTYTWNAEAQEWNIY